MSAAAAWTRLVQAGALHRECRDLPANDRLRVSATFAYLYAREQFRLACTRAEEGT